MILTYEGHILWHFCTLVYTIYMRKTLKKSAVLYRKCSNSSIGVKIYIIIIRNDNISTSGKLVLFIWNGNIYMSLLMLWMHYGWISAMETELAHRNSIRTPPPPGLTEEQLAMLEAASEEERAWDQRVIVFSCASFVFYVDVQSTNSWITSLKNWS